MQARGIRSLGLIVVGALALAVIGGLALTHATGQDATMWGWHGGWHDGTWNGGHAAGWTGWGWGTMLLGLLWLALLVALSVYLVGRLATRTRTDGHAADGALAVLDERYARGEIDDEEFERRRARLTGEDDR